MLVCAVELETDTTSVAVTHGVRVVAFGFAVTTAEGLKLRREIRALNLSMEEFMIPTIPADLEDKTSGVRGLRVVNLADRAANEIADAVDSESTASFIRS